MPAKFRKEIYELIYDSIDPWLWQMPNDSKDEIFKGMVYDIENHIAFPFEKNGLMFYIKPENIWLYRVHMFSKTKSLTKTIENSVHITDHLFDTCKDLQKIYGLNPFKGFTRMIHRAGWQNEGVLTKSLMTKEGVMIDQYVYGITREQNLKFRKGQS